MIAMDRYIHEEYASCLLRSMVLSPQVFHLAKVFIPFRHHFLQSLSPLLFHLNGPLERHTRIASSRKDKGREHAQAFYDCK